MAMVFPVTYPRSRRLRKNGSKRGEGEPAVPDSNVRKHSRGSFPADCAAALGANVRKVRPRAPRSQRRFISAVTECSRCGAHPRQVVGHLQQEDQTVDAMTLE